MADKTLVIVESPTKAKTIKKFLGAKYKVMASNGHIRDLPNSASEIPAKVKKEAWSKIGVNVDDNFTPLYIIPKSKKAHVKDLKAALKESKELLLATDEDREGESISWHLIEALKPKVPIKRLVFHEITKDAIKKAIENTREVDVSLVKAQETRRIVDRLYGYEVSPLLWRKMAPRLSAGRVQSVAVRLLVEKERERIKFNKADYWSLTSKFFKDSEFLADLTHLDKKRIATGKDFDPDTGKLKDSGKVIALNKKQAEELASKLKKETPVVNKIEQKPFSSKPPAPFVTSSLQMESNRKLRLSAQRTMGIAQQLYENGFITYMRTDSTTLSSQALNAARDLIQKDFGKDYLPKEIRTYSTKVKNAQEAHEAIRPAGDSFKSVADVKKALGNEAAKLYELIWKRTIASQMKNAEGTYVTAQIKLGEGMFRASGKTISFPGFLRAYVEGSDDPEAELADKEKILPKMKEGESIKTNEVNSNEHTTKPPARYTEGSLIKILEQKGIGRPSTWATVVQTVLSRSYAFKKGSALVPTYTAIGVVGLLEKHFTNLVNYEFTAKLEDDLDAISRGEADNVEYLKKFYFGNGHPGLKTLVTDGIEKIDPREVCGLPIGNKEDGTLVEVRIGKYGPFISDGENRASVLQEQEPDGLTLDKAVEILTTASKAPESIGLHPETGEPIYLKTGPYGPYVQLGDVNENEKGKKIKPKMASLLSNIIPDDVDLAYAVKLLSLPRNLGKYEDEDVIAMNGRFGPYIKNGTETRSINLDELSPLDISLAQATELLKQPKKSSRRKAAKPKELKSMGKHPVSEKELKVLSGRYGPYVTDGEYNATIPKGQDPMELTIEQAVDLIEARAAKGPAKKKRKKRRG